MKERTNWAELSTEASRDRRREPRVPLKFPIEVSGFDCSGRYFVEKTFTVNVSEGGCCFRIQREVSVDSVVAIKLVSGKKATATSDRPVLFQVVRVVREQESWTVGAAKLQPEGLWCLTFPKSKDVQ